jgi:hypothetical protein
VRRTANSLEGYCFTESRLVCASCLFAACKAHNSVPVAIAAHTCAVGVRARGSTETATSAALRGAAADIARLRQQAIDNGTSTLASLAAAEAQLQRVVSERFASLRGQILTEFGDRQAVLAGQEASLTSFGAALALRARGLECALVNSTVLPGDHPIFPASLPAVLAAASAMATLANRLEKAGVRRPSATVTAFREEGLFAAVAAVRQACAVVSNVDREKVEEVSARRTVLFSPLHRLASRLFYYHHDDDEDW